MSNYLTMKTDLCEKKKRSIAFTFNFQDSLMKVLQEKIEAVTKLSDLEKSLKNAEEECTHLKDSCEKTQDELQLLAEKYQDQLKEVQDLQIQLQVLKIYEKFGKNCCNCPKIWMIWFYHCAVRPNGKHCTPGQTALWLSKDNHQIITNKYL